MRVITWNCRRATRDSAVWDYLLELEPDIAMLQEVGSPSAKVEARYQIIRRKAITKTGNLQRFDTAVLTKGQVVEEVRPRAAQTWVNSELERFHGNIVGCRIRVADHIVNVTNAYSPAWPVARERLEGVDTDGVQLTQNRDVWVTDLIYAAFTYRGISPTEWFLFGGDLNMSETFDAWKDGPRGNLEYLDRLRDLGLVECLRHTHGQLVPTFKNPRGKAIIHQMDHLFASEQLLRSLTGCMTGDQERVFGGRLSDHLPVIADFDILDTRKATALSNTSTAS